MTTIIDSFGKPLFKISGTDEIVNLNTPQGCAAVEDPPSTNMYYQDGWVEMPPQPSLYHSFDFVEKQWVDPRSLDDIKVHKWEEIKSLRDQLEFGGFEFEGNVYDSDQVSQGRIMGAASAGVDQVWTLADNTTVELTAQQLKELYIALQSHIANAHERGRVARQAIYEATTAEQVEAIEL